MVRLTRVTLAFLAHESVRSFASRDESCVHNDAAHLAWTS